MLYKYYYQEPYKKDFTFNEVLCDVAQELQDKIQLYMKQKDKRIVFAYQDALRVVHKIEQIYNHKREVSDECEFNRPLVKQTK